MANLKNSNFIEKNEQDDDDGDVISDSGLGFPKGAYPVVFGKNFLQVNKCNEITKSIIELESNSFVKKSKRYKKREKKRKKLLKKIENEITNNISLSEEKQNIEKNYNKVKLMNEFQSYFHNKDKLEALTLNLENNIKYLNNVIAQNTEKLEASINKSTELRNKLENPNDKTQQLENPNDKTQQLENPNDKTQKQQKEEIKKEIKKTCEQIKEYEKKIKEVNERLAKLSKAINENKTKVENKINDLPYEYKKIIYNDDEKLNIAKNIEEVNPKRILEFLTEILKKKKYLKEIKKINNLPDDMIPEEIAQIMLNNMFKNEKINTNGTLNLNSVYRCGITLSQKSREEIVEQIKIFNNEVDIANGVTMEEKKESLIADLGNLLSNNKKGEHYEIYLSSSDPEKKNLNINIRNRYELTNYLADLEKTFADDKEKSKIINETILLLRTEEFRVVLEINEENRVTTVKIMNGIKEIKKEADTGTAIGTKSEGKINKDTENKACSIAL